jgi:hypothetical protein
VISEFLFGERKGVLFKEFDKRGRYDLIQRFRARNFRIYQDTNLETDTRTACDLLLHLLQERGLIQEKANTILWQVLKNTIENERLLIRAVEEICYLHEKVPSSSADPTPHPIAGGSSRKAHLALGLVLRRKDIGPNLSRRLGAELSRDCVMKLVSAAVRFRCATADILAQLEGKLSLEPYEKASHSEDYVHLKVEFEGPVDLTASGKTKIELRRLPAGPFRLESLCAAGGLDRFFEYQM